MNVLELKEKIAQLNGINDTELMVMGADALKLTKIRGLFRAIQERCQIVINNTEKSNVYINDITEYIKTIESFGLPLISNIKQAEKELSDPAVEAPVATKPANMPSALKKEETVLPEPPTPELTEIAIEDIP